MSNQTSVAGGRSEPGHGTAYLQLGLVVLLWGSNWPFMKVALADIAPLSFTALRLVGTTLVLVVLAPVMRFPLLPVRGERMWFATIGILQAGLFMALTNFGLQFVPPGRAAVLAYTMQMWALPLGILLLGERPSLRKLLGALVTFVGVLAFFNPALIDWSDHKALFGYGLVIAASFSWALGATLFRRRVWRTPFWTQTFWQLAVSMVFVAPLPILAGAFPGGDARPIHWSPTLLIILVYNWVAATGLGYWLWGRALVAMPASQAGQFVTLVPVTALALSVALTGEPLTLGVLGSAALIGVGILVTARAR